MTRSFVLAVALLGIFAASCSGGVSGTPSQPTAAGALERDSAVITTYQEPLVVDWRPEDRTDLEVAMRRRIAVVRMESRGVRLLNDCHIDGDYGYVGVNKKEEVVSFRSADEIKANLPAAAALFGAQLKAEMQQGVSLDLGLVIVGKRTALRVRAAPSDLRGECPGATHFVRSATVGAFALRTGTQRQLHSAASLFTVAADASSSSKKTVNTTDGSQKDCGSGDPEAMKPPPGCSALLRLELRPVAEDSGSSSSQENVPVCPNGMVWSGIKCTKESRDPHACTAGDAEDCAAQCERGHAESCSRIAWMHRNGDGVQADAGASARYFKRACDLGYQRGCSSYGANLFYGRGVARDLIKATELFRSSCEAGDPDGCRNLGANYLEGSGVERSIERAHQLYKRSCDGGSALGCTALAGQYLTGAGIDRNPAEAIEIFTRTCDGGHGAGCVALGAVFGRGNDVPEDPVKAANLYRKGCDLLRPQGCSNLGRYHLEGRGVEESAEKAVELFTKGCGLWNGDDSCVELARSYEKGVGVDQDAKEALTILGKNCDEGGSESCNELGLMHERGRAGLAKDLLRAVEYYRRACDAGSAAACRNTGLAYEKGRGVAPDRRKALELYKAGCDLGSSASCLTHATRLMGKAAANATDIAEAARLLDNVCARKKASACSLLAQMHLSGRGVEVAPTRAAELYQRACDLGAGSACRELGLRLVGGIGLQEDAARGLTLLERGCAAKDATACAEAGRIHHNGKSDALKAVGFYRLACEGKHGPSCATLASMFARAEGVARDQGKAERYYTAACEHGVDESCLELVEFVASAKGAGKVAQATKIGNLLCERFGKAKGCYAMALLYGRGEHVPQDLAKSLEYGAKACSRKLAVACDQVALGYAFGNGATASEEQASAYFSHGCRLGHEQSCWASGYYLAVGVGHAKDPVKGTELLRSGCRKQHKFSCEMLKRLGESP